jgi:hypothetical protein
MLVFIEVEEEEEVSLRSGQEGSVAVPLKISQKCEIPSVVES